MSRRAAETLRGGTCVGTAPASLRSPLSVPPHTDTPKLDPNLDLVCALLWNGDPAVLAHVADDDLDAPADRIVGVIRWMHRTGRIITPVTVGDELLRQVPQVGRSGCGPVTSVLAALREASTRGVCPEAARDLACAVVARSLRRRIETASVAMQSAAWAQPEADLAPMVAQIAVSVADCAHRLAVLRGEADG
ncbi:hypothetical protein [Mycobacterium sp. 852014-52144_SCH5372336]|uniref:hypothetical protein n=1 Tax=Mycobacterium sp. 852014-52144_SCH5372336 TaxID=1834115 RepID=UPI0007FCD6D8|nr:hypothetical protein [Mycobacterium sp. 852014-52144_SCH5372336]OBB76813.1 hypothetical protein A5759_05260 [Mycobacterium sp. 852014-52144_SCH5372336]